MILSLQITGLLFSLLYGFLYALFISLNHKMIYGTKRYIKIISSLVIILIGVLGYFILLKKITSGAFHIYFVFALLIGSFLEGKGYKYLAKRFKKWYTHPMIGWWKDG